MTTTAATPSTPAGSYPSTTTGTVDPASKIASEVAWAFIPQYYTHLSRTPEELHRFYTKNSSLLHGIEGEETGICSGQAEIRKRITELEYKDRKIFIHGVDAQASVGGGIIVNVIGEISHSNGEEWRKFVQTFFLAQQQSGYYVHNDTFRILKEEAFTDEEEEPQQDQPTEVPVPATVGSPYTNGYHPEPEHHNHVEPVVQLQDLHAEPPSELTPEPVVITESREPTPPPPGPEPIAPAPEVRKLTPEPAPPLRSPSPSPIVTPSPPAPPAPEALVAVPSPALSTAPPAAAKPPTPSPIQAPAVPQPQQPKTWANLAAANSSKWGHTVASEAKGVSAAAPPQPRAPAPRPVAPRGPDLGPKNIPRDQQHAAYTAALQITNAQCFVKGVTENIPEDRLVQILNQQFGPIKEYEIVRNKACAFLEFKTLDAAKKAIIASLPASQGGDGCIKLDEKEFGPPARLNIEIRKERGDRPPPRPRGGAPISSGGHVAGDAGGGRGGPAYRGSARARGRGDALPPVGRGGPK